MRRTKMAAVPAASDGSFFAVAKVTRPVPGAHHYIHLSQQPKLVNAIPEVVSTRLVGDSNPVCVYSAMEVHIMRTNIVIDDKLMRDTLRATGLKTKRAAVEEGLRSLLRLKRQSEIRKLRGKLNWQGDLDAMRRDR